MFVSTFSQIWFFSAALVFRLVASDDLVFDLGDLFLVFFPLEIIGLTPSEESRQAPIEAARPFFPFVKVFCCLDLVGGLLLFVRLRFTFFTRFCIVVEVAVASLIIFRSEK